MLGGKFSIAKNIFAFAELRTEKQSRIGLFVAKLWEYTAANINGNFNSNTIPDSKVSIFSEGYAESILLPLYHQHPVSTVWFKQGWRYRPYDKILMDPFFELYIRRSPISYLGQDTEQGRLGLRTTLINGQWNVSVLIYKAFSLTKAPHNEGLLILNGTF